MQFLADFFTLPFLTIKCCLHNVLLCLEPQIFNLLLQVCSMGIIVKRNKKTRHAIIVHFSGAYFDNELLTIFFNMGHYIFWWLLLRLQCFTYSVIQSGSV